MLRDSMVATASGRRAAMRRQLRDVQQRFDVPVLFCGESSAGGIVLSDFAGTRTNALRGLVIQPGLGLGGRAMATGSPCSCPGSARSRHRTGCACRG